MQKMTTNKIVILVLFVASLLPILLGCVVQSKDSFANVISTNKFEEITVGKMEPPPQKVFTGTSRKNAQQHHHRHVTVTAYSAIKKCPSSFITANNNRVRPGIVAVSRDLFKQGWTFGKRVLLDKQILIIDDILPSRKNGLDIYMSSLAEASDYGFQKKEVTLLD